MEYIFIRVPSSVQASLTLFRYRKFKDNIFLDLSAQPSTDWLKYYYSEFYHPVHLNGNLTPAVEGVSGNVISCHIRSPDGEDLVITSDSAYPGLTLVSGTSLCSIAMGPIDRHFLGDWLLYGIFKSSLSTTEIQLPIHLFLYGEYRNLYRIFM